MGRITSFSKQVIKLLICFCLIYTPFFAYASAAESWTIEEVKYNNVGKSLSYTASRPNAIAANDYVYKAKVGVTSARTGSTVANMIRMGLAGAAIYGIVEGVGWIIENGIVKKKDPHSADTGGPLQFMATSIWRNTAQEACNDALYAPYTGCIVFFEHDGTANGKYSGALKTPTNTPTKGAFAIFTRSNPGYQPPDYVPVPDSELGDAVNDSPQAPTVLPDIYNPNNPAGGQAPEATDDALNSASPEPRSEPTGESKPKPNTDTDADGVPDTYDPNQPSVGSDYTLPAFCSWAATVCDWYIKYKEDVKNAEKHREDEQVVWTNEETHRTKEKEVWQEEKTHRTDEKTFWERVTDWFDWTTQDHQFSDDDTELDIPDSETSDVDTEISFNGYCPAPLSSDINFMGLNKTIEFSFDPVCQIAEFIKPVVISISAFSAALIVAGIRTEDD